MAAKIVYPSGDPAPTTYILPKNYDFGHQSGYLDVDDTQRAFDGTLYSYSGPTKKVFNLTFTYASKAQLDYLVELWSKNYDLDLYLDGTTLDATVKIMEPPDNQSEPVWSNGELSWSFSLVMQEI